MDWGVKCLIGTVATFQRVFSTPEGLEVVSLRERWFNERGTNLGTLGACFRGFASRMNSIPVHELWPPQCSCSGILVGQSRVPRLQIAK